MLWWRWLVRVVMSYWQCFFKEGWGLGGLLAVFVWWVETKSFVKFVAFWLWLWLSPKLKRKRLQELLQGQVQQQHMQLCWKSTSFLGRHLIRRLHPYHKHTSCHNPWWFDSYRYQWLLLDYIPFWLLQCSSSRQPHTWSLRPCCTPWYCITDCFLISVDVTVLGQPAVGHNPCTLLVGRNDHGGWGGDTARGICSVLCCLDFITHSC